MSLHTRLKKLEEVVARRYPDLASQLSDEEVIARLRQHTEMRRDQKKAIECVLQEPGSEAWTDEQVAVRCGYGVTAELVATYRRTGMVDPRFETAIQKALPRLRAIAKRRRLAAERAAARTEGSKIDETTRPRDNPATGASESSPSPHATT